MPRYHLYKCRKVDSEAWEEVVAERPEKAVSQYAGDLGLVQGDEVEVDFDGTIRKFTIFTYSRQ